jgi:hypothetical protein
VFGQPAPPSPGPGPAPPKPAPPADPLLAKLQAAYAADPNLPPLKAAQRILLIGLYEAMAAHAAQPNVATVGRLKADLDATAKAMTILPTALLELRKMIAQEVLSVTGKDPAAALDDALRAKVAACFSHVAAALTLVK